MKYYPFKCFRYCFVVLTLIASWSSYCLAFSRYEENNSPVELLTRSKALYSLQKHLPEPMPDATDTSGVVNNDWPDTGLIAIGGMFFSFVKAWLTSEENNDYPDKLIAIDEVSLVTVKSDADELLFNTYQFERLSETSDSDTFQVNYRIREVPNTGDTPSSQSPQADGSSSNTNTVTRGNAATVSHSSVLAGGACGGGGGGGDDKKPDGTKYTTDAGLPDDITDLLELMETLYTAAIGRLNSSHEAQLVKKLNGRIIYLNRDIRKLQSDLEGLKSTTISRTDIDNEIRKLNDQIKTLEIKIAGTNRISEVHSLEMTTIQERLTNMEQSLTELQSQPQIASQSIASYNGVLVWRIDNFNQRRNDAINGVKTAMYSKPFYTDRFGYKCGAKIYLNGDGFGKGSHISLFFLIMRGEYDALQVWPFYKKITMLLLDQGSGDHMIDAFHSDPQSDSFQRPKSDLNIASGSPLFMPQESLKNRQYVKDNVMFIKIIVNSN
ncbi:hypothetical protein [Endozoicomonas euniceicola]|uniref:MATH domain-containing protein n=1 Tax=Endozoicomonas euniceicola TaxID=1234143 RepID=A0ABY6GXC8_9GAMM|nr:hypothetical protein [Endozoicomonas euniceicola]UYM17222.1 hypothetical protein NX720_04670 [Endozoicomonas euniceicola]